MICRTRKPRLVDGGRSNVGARLGQRSLSVTPDTYTHVLLDDREVDHLRLVGMNNLLRSSS